MEKSWLLHMFYITGVSLLLNTDVIHSRIFEYKDDNEYLQVLDRTKFERDILDRHKRSTTEENTKSSNVKGSINNISSEHVFPGDSNNVAFVFWKHAKTSVIFILTCQSANTTNYNKHSNKGCKSKSNFYRSDNHGKSFNKLTKEIKDAHLHSIYLSPINNKLIILTDYKNQSLHITIDEGVTFKKYDIPFSPTFIYFHPSLEKYIAAYDNSVTGENALYISENRGVTWIQVSKKVRNYFWAREKYDDDNRTLFIEKQSEKQIDSKTFSSFLYASMPPYNPNKTQLIYNQHLMPFSVFVGQQYIITQRWHDRKLYILAGKGKEFAMATFNEQTKAHRMHIVISDENNEILLAIIHPDIRASLYLSDESGTNFLLRQSDILTESIKRHAVPPKMDFYKVKGVYGTYIINKRRTVRRTGSSITFDKGYTWHDVKCENKDVKGKVLSQRCGKQCDLILYLKIEHLFSDFTAPIISKTNAPGIIIAQGFVGKIRPIGLKHHVFMSIDGGYTWKQKLSTSNGYVLLDHGGLIAATPLKFTVNHYVTYTMDYGNNWISVHLTKMYSRIAAIITESTASLLMVNVFGFLQDNTGASSKRVNTWIVWRFNFSKVLNRRCEAKDYQNWNHNKNACVMGERIYNKRRKADSHCISGPDFKNGITKDSCKCTYDDFTCDQDFYIRKKDNKTVCVPINPKHVVSICKKGKMYLKSKGYRKLYGNKCENGVDKQLSPTLTKCPVTKPGYIKIKASTTLEAVNKEIKFYIKQTNGFYNATYVWKFPDQKKHIVGSYTQVKEVTHKFEKHGKYNVTLSASNIAGTSTAIITVHIIDDLYLNAFVSYDFPIIANVPERFSLKIWDVNATLRDIGHLPSTKFMWSFDGVYSGDPDLSYTVYTFPKSGRSMIEVQIVNVIGFRSISQAITVFHSSVVVELSFSPLLDQLNMNTSTWIIDFETKYKRYLDIKYNLDAKVSQRAIVRGNPEVPTKISIIFVDTKETLNTNLSASRLAEMVIKDINSNHPLVKGYETQGIRVLNAKIRDISEIQQDKSSHVWVYVFIIVVIMGFVTLSMAYYQYRRKGRLLCIYKSDGMNKQLIDEEETEFVEEVQEIQDI